MLLVMKKDKGIALLLTLVIMIALAVMSVGLQSIIVASSKNNARSHILNVTYRVAEYGLENGRISLIQELTKVGTGIITNVKHLDLSEVENLHYEDNELTRSCLALHGYNKSDTEIFDLNLIHTDIFISNRFWYTRLSSKHPTLIGHTAGPESFSTDPLFEDYTFENWPIKSDELKPYLEKTCKILNINNQFRKAPLDEYINQVEYQYFQKCSLEKM